MELVRFRIYDYKSIRDTGDCYLASDITVLAGKNESGKTTILEALEDFNTDRQIRPDALPLHESNLQPKIDAEFRILPREAEMIGKALKFTGSALSAIPSLVTITKTYPDRYAAESLNDLETLFSGEIQKARFSMNSKARYFRRYDKPAALLGLPSFPWPIESEGCVSTLNSYFDNISPRVEELIPSESSRAEYSEKVESLLLVAEKLDEHISRRDAVLPQFTDRIPTFVLFKSFEDVIPNSVGFRSAIKNEWIRDLAAISDLDPRLVVNEGSEARGVQHKRTVTVQLRENYLNFWEQDVSHLGIEWNSKDIQLWVFENDKPYQPTARSKGKQWHLAFYIKVTARSAEGKNNIVLIDEPGLYLHAKAQKDVLRNLEFAARNSDCQVVFSTHSPYLIDPDKLGRIRLVIKTDASGTVIEGKIHKVADKETLTPVYSAMGIALTEGIANIDLRNNVVVEGMTDWYYMEAFRRLLGVNDVRFVYGGGAGNMGVIGTILRGWGAEVRYLFDNDRGRRDGTKKLKNTWKIEDSLMLVVSEQQGDRIEDLFSKRDFCSAVLRDPEARFTGRNSDVGKAGIAYDKVLSAKLFLERMDGGDCTLANSTRRKFESLFARIHASFH